MTPTAPSTKTSSYLGPLLIIGGLFFIFGFVTWVNSVLIAFFKEAFSLTAFQSTLVAFAFFISYTLMAIPSSAVLKRTGFKNGMSLGLIAMAVDCPNRPTTANNSRKRRRKRVTSSCNLMQRG